MSLSEDANKIIMAIRETSSDNQRQIQAVLARLERLDADVERVKNAFPDSDPDGHRRYHETVIEWRELRNQMVKSALIQAAKVGGFAGFGWVMYALWVAFKMEVNK